MKTSSLKLSNQLLLHTINPQYTTIFTYSQPWDVEKTKLLKPAHPFCFLKLIITNSQPLPVTHLIRKKWRRPQQPQIIAAKSLRYLFRKSSRKFLIFNETLRWGANRVSISLEAYKFQEFSSHPVSSMQSWPCGDFAKTERKSKEWGWEKFLSININLSLRTREIQVQISSFWDTVSWKFSKYYFSLIVGIYNFHFTKKW